jgi:beta-glucanase (GH16 family)
VTNIIKSKGTIMKIQLAGVVLALATLPVAAAGNWKLVWSDEFDKPGLPDPAKWNYEEGFVRNNEAQYYTRVRSDNARVENGMLIIEARKERFPNPSYDPAAQENKAGRRGREFAEYTSASLTTLGKASWTYGRIEVRAKLPPGRGTWPAIWTLGTNVNQVGWPVCGEIDIMEFVGFKPGIIHANIHADNRNRTQKTDKGSQLAVPDASEAFHVYALEWDAKHMDVLVDDNKYFTFTKDDSGKNAWPYDGDQYLILNLAIGGAWGGAKGIDDTCFPQRFYIDYVRVYQRKD